MNNKKIIRRALGLTLLTLISCFSFDNLLIKAEKSPIQAIRNISSLFGYVDYDIEAYFNPNIVYRLPDTVKQDEEISVIITLDNASLYDTYKNVGYPGTFDEFVETPKALKQAEFLNNAIERKINDLKATNLKFTLGEKYNVLLTGFEVSIKASTFDALNEIVGYENVTVGEVYEKCETEVVTNDVDVYETGIFDSSLCDYQGDGVVVAVLDTGLDYSHTAFSPDNFTTTNEAFKLNTVSEKIALTKAYTFTPGLTGEDVYVNRKVPYAYDYADKDADVSPINSEHGTHVAGIIAGLDDTITGVAPNAQLAIFKVFSDHAEGAKSSWLIAALEDCVTLGVDVINMSLGSACGFTREVDKEKVNVIYDKVKDSGIELIASAANQYNATMGSKKNGNNPLTNNPDSGTVGSPSTYLGPLSVASVEGVKTSYLKVGETIIYFNEASTNSADDKKSFVNDMLATLDENVTKKTFEYVVIPGIGRSSDYPDENSFYEGKIVLVKRGTTTFEDKVRVALKEKGAAGIIIYNNVSGTISMSVGANIGAVCSVSQDDGEYLISQVDKETGIGKIEIDKENLAGPFMSDFSSWGPTSDLHIKPEITAHGGQILSAVPGQAYERLSGTSMAAPNLSGAAALICQYVKYSGVFGKTLTTQEITSIVNQLMMSTADIVYEKNGLPASIRKQGAGLVSITKSTTAESYLSAYDTKGNKIDRAKLELGDDVEKTGIYTMTFDINNISNGTVQYDINAITLTEGVSTTYTSHSGTTVTQNAYELKALCTVVNVLNGTNDGNRVTVEQGKSAKVTVQVTLSDQDKDYLNKSFANGMYVEGFITLDGSASSLISLNIPFLGFYGDWTQAPIFDEEYYDTNVDELNKGLDDQDKLMEDAFSTRVIGGLYSDYISTLGSYYFTQDPKATQIAASKEHIAVSNQNRGQSGSTISSIRSVSAGLLRNAKEIDISIVEESTGIEIYNKTVTNQHKSFSSGSTIYGSSIDIEFATLENDLKNNTRYICTLTAYIDYGTHESQNNVRNTFTFPFFVDFEAPIVTDVRYHTEYDKSTETTKLYADIDIYDNFYAMGCQLGQIVRAPEGSNYTFTMNSFGKYVTPVYGSFNTTSTITVELTDYVRELKNSVGIEYGKDGSFSVKENTNTFIANVYDYAMNSATYEITLPNDIIFMYFENDQINLSPNETLDLSKVLKIYPETTWIQTLDFTSSNNSVAAVINNTLIGKEAGDAVICAKGFDKNGNEVTASVNVHVLSESEEGYVGNYSVPEISSFALTGYKTIKAFHQVNSDDRKIGVDGGEYDFDDTITLEMFPSETVKLLYKLDSFFPEQIEVRFRSSNSKIATVDEEGNIVAQAKGNTTIMVSVYFNGASTLFSAKVAIQVKDPFNLMSIYLYNYRGLGGEVIIPGDRGITTIYDYAFSNYKYVEKDLSAGDVIDEEDPYYIKQQFIGDDTIKKVVIPEGVTTINKYAFANLTALEEVVLPSTLTRIGVGAFYGCTNLKKINLENVKFINERAFYDCPLEEIDLASAVSIGTYAFENCKLQYIVLPQSTQSIADGAFYNNMFLSSVELKASKVKIGPYAFAKCPMLHSVDINASVISAYAFAGDSELTEVVLGKDVAVIGEFAFADTQVERFELNARNKYLTLEEDGALILKDNELILVAPGFASKQSSITTTATVIASGAFAGIKKLKEFIGPNVEIIKSYAFSECINLSTIDTPNLKEIGDYAFVDTALTTLNGFTNLTKIGNYAFAKSSLARKTVVVNSSKSWNCSHCNYLNSPVDNVCKNCEERNTTSTIIIVMPDGTEMYKFNFALTNLFNNYGENYNSLEEIELGDNVEIGKYAFAANPRLHSITLGENTTIQDYAFFNNVSLYTYDATSNFSHYTPYTYVVKDIDGNPVKTSTYYKYNFIDGVKSQLKEVTIGANSSIGEAAFFGNGKLTKVHLLGSTQIGAYAFYCCAMLSELDFTKVISIGDYAFSGYRTQDFCLEDNSWRYAYEFEYDDGVFVNTAYVYSCFAPCFTTVDLTTVTEVGKGVFMGNTNLTTVVLGNNRDVINEYMFANCSNLKTIDLGEVTKIYEYAFYNSGISLIDLSKVTEIGESAFYHTKLQDIALGNDAVIGDYAFYYVTTLKNIFNQEKMKSVGSYAFALTRLTSLNLNNVTSIGDFAFSNTTVEEVTLGNSLTMVGENPFYMTNLTTFGKVVDDVFDGNIVGEKIIESYKLNEEVQVLDGVLYKTVPTGLVLVSFPTKSDTTNYTVAANTTRISACAFAGSNVEIVTLSNILKSIGDKAFYACEGLKVVTFTSYEAPLLEEKYNTSYLTYLNLPLSGQMGEYVGLGISKYYMWNVTSDYTNFYFGATFKDYIGHTDKNVVLIRPQNGVNYNTFIFSEYFNAVLDGALAPTLETLAVIEAIKAIPTSITLETEAIIVNARKLYDGLTKAEQVALVTNFPDLKKAESTLEYLKNRENSGEKDPGENTDPVPSIPFSVKVLTFLKNNAFGLTLSVVLVICFTTTLIIVTKKQGKKEEQ